MLCIIVYAISFQYFVLLCSAYVDLPLKIWKDGSKSGFVQAPFISTIQNAKLLRLQKDISQLWPKGVIRYHLDNQSYDSYINSSLQAAMMLIETESCIKFKEESQKPTDKKTWIHFTNPYKERSCVHEAQFMQRGEIMVTLGYDCLKFKDILHAILHGIGFKDEVTHPHRDKYIKVLWNNIHPGYRNLFIKEPTDSARSSIEYDPFSIMHFHERAYSINGKATIMPSEPGLIINPSDSLSQLDRMRLHLYFGHECNRRNINRLLDSCKMTLQNKDNNTKKHKNDTKNSLGKEKDVEEDDATNDNDKEDDKNNENLVDGKYIKDEKINDDNDDNDDDLAKGENVDDENTKEKQNNDDNNEDLGERQTLDHEITKQNQNDDDNDDGGGLKKDDEIDDEENFNKNIHFLINTTDTDD